MPFFPANPELQAQLNKEIDPELFSRIFDSALQLRLKQQESAQSIFKSIAASNPELAGFLLGQPGVTRGLTEVPTPFIKKRGIPIGAALEMGANAYEPPSKVKSADVRGATQIMLKLAQAGKAAFGQDVIDEKGIQRGTKLLAGGSPLDSSIVGGDTAKFSALIGSDSSEQGLQQQLLDARVKEIEASGKPVSAEERLRIYREDILGRTPAEIQSELLQARLSQIEMGLQNADLRYQLTDALANLGRPMTVQEQKLAENDAAQLKTEIATLEGFSANLGKASAGDASARLTLMTSLSSVQDKNLFGVLQAISSQAALGQQPSPASASLIQSLIVDRKRRLASLTSRLSAETPRQPAPIPGKAGATPAAAPSRVDNIMKLLQGEMEKLGMQPATSSSGANDQPEE